MCVCVFVCVCVCVCVFDSREHRLYRALHQLSQRVKERWNTFNEKWILYNPNIERLVAMVLFIYMLCSCAGSLWIAYSNTVGFGASFFAAPLSLAGQPFGAQYFYAFFWSFYALFAQVRHRALQRLPPFRAPPFPPKGRHALVCLVLLWLLPDCFGCEQLLASLFLFPPETDMHSSALCCCGCCPTVLVVSSSWHPFSFFRLRQTFTHLPCVAVAAVVAALPFWWVGGFFVHTKMVMFLFRAILTAVCSRSWPSDLRMWERHSSPWS